MGLGWFNEIIALGAVMARVRYLNIGFSPAETAEPHAEQQEVYKAAAAFAAQTAPPTGQCLEICAGFGNGLPLLQQQGNWQVEGIDGGIVSTAFARLSGAKIRHSPVENAPYPNNSFDHVIGVECIVCLNEVDTGLKEVARILKAGGVATIAEFRKGSLADARQRMEQCGATAGLSLVRFQDMSGVARRSIVTTAERRKKWVRWIPPPFRSWASEYASLPGSVKYAEWEAGRRCYYIACLVKRD